MTLPPEDTSTGEYEEWLGLGEENEDDRAQEIEREIEELQESRHRERVKNMPITWTTRDGRKVPVTEMADDHLQNAIAMLARVEMPPGHDFPPDGMAAYYADQQMDHEWGRYFDTKVWLRVLRREQHRRRDPSARCSHGVCFHDCSARAEAHRQNCAEDFE